MGHFDDPNHSRMHVSRSDISGSLWVSHFYDSEIADVFSACDKLNVLCDAQTARGHLELCDALISSSYFMAYHSLSVNLCFTSLCLSLFICSSWFIRCARLFHSRGFISDFPLVSFFAPSTISFCWVESVKSCVANYNPSWYWVKQSWDWGCLLGWTIRFDHVTHTQIKKKLSKILCLEWNLKQLTFWELSK